MEPKKKWALCFVDFEGDSAPWITITARGRAKAEKKILRRLDRRRGAFLLIASHPYAFRIERHS